LAEEKEVWLLCHLGAKVGEWGKWFNGLQIWDRWTFQNKC
jgi:hypothetical protein